MSFVGQILWTSELPKTAAPDILKRTGPPPEPFHAPISAAGIELVETPSRASFEAALGQTSDVPRVAFIYNLSKWHLPVIWRYAHQIPFVIYYQNVRPERLFLYKRLAARFALKRARLVLLQDKCCLDYYRPWLGEERTQFFPWHVDDRFFDPGLSRPVTTDGKPWLFVPGDRARLDDVVLAIARRTDYRILRVARWFAPGVLDAYRACPNVEIRHFVPWAELRDLYVSASVVLNVADDRETSAGMTTFLEALALNARVVTPSGHSSSGYAYPDGYKPYETVEDPLDVDQWIAAIDRALGFLSATPERSPRDLFLSLAGVEASAVRWLDVLRRASAQT